MHRKDTRVSNADSQDQPIVGWTLLAVTAALLWTGGVSFGCTAVQRVSDQQHSGEQAYLKLAVEPTSAEVYVDGDYRGKIEKWNEGIVPLKPGERRIKLTADGYVTRRFDVRLEVGKSKTLELEMEPELNDFESRSSRRDGQHGNQMAQRSR